MIFMIRKREIKNSVVKRLLIIMTGFTVLNSCTSYTAEANSQIGNISYWYADNDIRAVIKSRLGDSVYVAPAVPSNTELIKDVVAAALLEAQTGKPALIPVNLNNNHWTGIAIRRKLDGNIIVFYNDSFGTSVGGESSESGQYIAAIKKILPTAEIVDLRVHQQNDGSSCGAFTAENLIALAVRRFQKLSIDIIDLFGESLISTFCYLRFKLYDCIVSKLLIFCKGIKFTCIGFLFILCAHGANADELVLVKNQIRQLIAVQEEQNNIPSGLLLAIATVESGSEPYALNIQGKSVIGRNKTEAVNLIHEALAKGITNIDVGVMQLNVKWHRENFKSIEEMLEPKKNIEYATGFLLKLYKKYGDWHRAVRFYHSSTAEYYRKYSRKITLAWIGV